LHLLQALEIPQNRQSFLWKSLEKTSGNLEMFGKSLQGPTRPGGGAKPGTWPEVSTPAIDIFHPLSKLEFLF